MNFFRAFASSRFWRWDRQSDLEGGGWTCIFNMIKSMRMETGNSSNTHVLHSSFAGGLFCPLCFLMPTGRWQDQCELECFKNNSKITANTCLEYSSDLSKMWQWKKTWLLKVVSFPYMSYLEEITFISGKLHSQIWVLISELSNPSLPVQF